MKFHKVIPFLGGLIGAILLLLVGHSPNDDAYITFRHSKNFAEHGQLVWNLNDKEKVLGSSTPLFSFLLGILGIFFGSENIPYISLYVNAFIVFFIGYLVYLISHTFVDSKFISFLISLLISVNSFSIRIYSQGFEFALFTFLIFANLYLLFNSQNNFQKILSLFLPNFLILTRIEGIFIYPLVFIILYYWIRKKYIPFWYAFFPFIFIFYAVFSYFYYDQILPQSIYSKKAYQEIFPVYPLSKDLSEQFSQRLFIVKQFWSTSLSPILRFGTEEATLLLNQYPYKPGNFFLNRNSILLNYSIIISIFLIYKFYKNKRFLELYYFMYIPFFIIFVFYTIRVEYWYFPPLLSTYLFFLSIGTYYLFDVVFEYLGKYLKIQNKKIYILNFIMFIFLLLWLGKNFYIINLKSFPFDEYRGIIYSPGMRDKVEWERYLVYKDTIHFLKENHIKGEIAAYEIGVMGFFYEGNLLDLFGLCSKKVIQYYYENFNHQQKEDYTVYVLKKEKPELFISGMDLSIDSPLKQYLLDNYKIIYLHPKYKVFGDNLYIWQRKY